MTKRSFLIPALAALMVACPLSNALEVRDYLPSRHDRFTGFPGSPQINVSPIYDGNKFLGVGWRANDTRWQFVLVTRSHLLFATHAAPAVGTEIRFLNASDQIVSRQVAVKTVIENSDGSDSDLILLELDSPIDEADEVPPFPYLNYQLNSSYIGKTATVFGKTARVGSAIYSDFELVSGGGLNKTTTIRFDYDFDEGDDDDARLEGGDSGSPQFCEHNGSNGLVAINSAIGNEGNIQLNVGGFVPHYVPRINTVLSPLGYRMIPLNGAATSISGSTSITSPTPRQGKPLSITVTLENTGINESGNLEAEFHFAAGEAPDSISGISWVDYGGGDDPTLRRGLLSGFASTTLTLNWDSAPLVDSLDWSVDWRSDKSPDDSLNVSVPLDPSYDAWAANLSLKGPTDNPDEDRLLNLSEYAHGSDPENGINLLPNGEPAYPSVTGSGNTVILSYPERDDALVRGLAYIPQWSGDLDSASWSATPPGDLVSTTSPYDPAVLGFVKRTLSWTSSDAQQFVRVGVTLDEE